MPALVYNLQPENYMYRNDILSDVLCVRIFLSCVKMGNTFISLFFPMLSGAKAIFSPHSACMYMHLLCYIYSLSISSGLKASIPALFQHLMLTDDHFQTSQIEQCYKVRKGSLVVDCFY